MPIRLLSPDVAAKIAAGEVVERPASVVKELVENALDAGASQIEVELRAGGLNLVRVTDDGVGIPADELRLAVLRHATSKLETAEQLWRVETLGFRGEALASIAAVARLTLVSRPPGEPAAAYIAVASETVIEEGRQGAPIGTTVFVRDLFKAIPARLAFLRSPAAEASRATQVVSHYALAYPEVAFRLLVDGRLLFHSPGSGDHRDVLTELWGPDTVSSLLEVQETHVGSTAVTGFAGPPDLLRARRDAQIAFVNRRWVDARVLSYAIADAYRDLVPRGRHPIVVLFLAVRPGDVDVNVHPAKAEVRFRREGEVFAVIQQGVRRTLAAHSLLPLDQVEAPSSFSAPPVIPAAPLGSDVALGAPPLFPPEPAHAADAPPVSSVRQPSSGLALRPVGQVAVTYIVAEGPDGMYLVDQHAAHERLTFDQLLASRSAGERPVQGLLDPFTVSLTRLQAQALAEMSDVLAAYGFQWEPFGEGSVLLRAVPASLREGQAAQTLIEALDEDRSRDVLPTDEGDSKTLPDTLHLRERRVAATIACHSTVRAGQTLTLTEMEALLRQFQAAHFPRLCPHGRPTMVHLSSLQLEKQFGRR